MGFTTMMDKNKCIIIDEVQRIPSLFPILRPVIDEHRIPARFLLLGSASPSLLKESSESLTGRIAYTELTGINLSELPENVTLHEFWLYGGFPNPCLSHKNGYARSWKSSIAFKYLSERSSFFEKMCSNGPKSTF